MEAGCRKMEVTISPMITDHFLIESLYKSSHFFMKEEQNYSPNLNNFQPPASSFLTYYPICVPGASTAPFFTTTIPSCTE